MFGAQFYGKRYFGGEYFASGKNLVGTEQAGYFGGAFFGKAYFGDEMFPGGHVAVVADTTDTHDGPWHKQHYDRLKRQAKLAEAAIYRNAPRPVLKLKNPTLPIDLRSEPFLPEVTVSPYIYDIGRMPLANPIQWLLDDDEEAITWLLQ